MTRRRLMDSRSFEGERLFYAERYPSGYQHHTWTAHVERIAESVNFLRPWLSRTDTVADLSCGDGALPLALGAGHTYLGDMSPARPVVSGTDVTMLPAGALPASLKLLPKAVDLLLCSETLEHMDDPDAFLHQARRWAKTLFVSTPVDEPGDYGNPEHYWSWGVADIAELLQDTGWDAVDHRNFTPPSDDWYTFQLWYARRCNR